MPNGMYGGVRGRIISALLDLFPPYSIVEKLIILNTIRQKKNK